MSLQVTHNQNNSSSIWHSHILHIFLLSIITLLTFSTSLTHEFVTDWDDQFYVTWNQAAWGFSRDHLKQAFSSYFVGNYAPMQIVSYMLDTTLWGLRPAGFIATNLFLHLANGILYYMLVWKLTVRHLWSFTAAAVFLLHPVQVESVVWVSQRKNVLSMFFFLLSIHLYIKYKESFDRKKLKYYAVSVALFILATLSKSVVVVLPFVLIAYDLCYLKLHERGKWLIDKMPYFLASIAIGLISIQSQSPEFDGGISSGWHGGSPLGTFYTMTVVMVRYVSLLFWPAGLSAFYGFPAKSSIDIEVVGAVILLLVTAWGGWYLLRTSRKMFFWAALAVLGIAPVSQIIPLVTFMNDRYLYFPMLGAAALVTGLVDNRHTYSVPVKKLYIIPAVAILITVLAGMSFNRSKVWQNSYTLWSDAHEKFPQSPLTSFGLGSIYLQRGDLVRARDYFLQAYGLGMKTKLVVLNLGRIYLSLGDLPQAQLYVTALTEKYPDYQLGLMLLGDYYRQVGNEKGASEAYSRVGRVQ